MRKLIVGLVVLLGLGIAGELVAPSIAEAKIDEAVRARSSGQVGVDADIRSFPFVTRLLLTGRVDKTDVTLTQVAGTNLTFTAVTYDVKGLQLDRTALYQQKIKISAIDKATVTARVDTAAIAAAYGLDEDKINEFLAVIAPRLKAALPRDLIPCEPVFRVDPGSVTLSCTFTEIPPIINKALEAEQS